MIKNNVRILEILSDLRRLRIFKIEPKFQYIVIHSDIFGKLKRKCVKSQNIQTKI